MTSAVATPVRLQARIERIETVRPQSQPNVLWVEVTDEDGVTGLGETYYVPGAVDAVIHDLAAPLLLGKDAARIEDVWQTLFACANFYGFAGAEMRAFSAIDIALWDLLGKRTGLSVATLLGGRVRDAIRVYNTCVDAGALSAEADDATVPFSSKSKLISLLVLSAWWISTAMTLFPATSSAELKLAE